MGGRGEFVYRTDAVVGRSRWILKPNVEPWSSGWKRGTWSEFLEVQVLVET